MTTTAAAPTASNRAQNAYEISRKLQHAERAIQEARRALLDAVALVENGENEPEFKASTMKALISSLDIASIPLGIDAQAWDQYTDALLSSQI